MHLAHMPEIQEEIVSQIPDPLTRESVNKIPILEGIMQEVLRIYFDGLIRFFNC
jgi:hypothetical protein